MDFLLPFIVTGAILFVNWLFEEEEEKKVE